MTRTGLVSIVMCAWKPRGDWFRDAVSSVLDQRDLEFELVLVDDGSPEPVESLLDPTDDPDGRIRLVRIEHAGLAAARNAGIAMARGSWFRFVDADDVLEPNSTARLVALSDGGRWITYGTTALCDAQMRPTGMKRSTLAGSIARECLLYRFDVRHMSMVFPRAVVEAVGPWDTTLRQCQDWDFVLRALEQAPARGEAAIATYYRRHGEAVSANVARAVDYETLVVDRYFARHPEEAGTEIEREARAKLLLVRAKAAPALGMGRRERLAHVARAAGLHPRRTAEEVGRDAYWASRAAAGTAARRLGLR